MRSVEILAMPMNMASRLFSVPVGSCLICTVDLSLCLFVSSFFFPSFTLFGTFLLLAFLGDELEKIDL